MDNPVKMLLDTTMPSAKKDKMSSMNSDMKSEEPTMTPEEMDAKKQEVLDFIDEYPDCFTSDEKDYIEAILDEAEDKADPADQGGQEEPGED
jgi:hypothetical protein